MRRWLKRLAVVLLTYAGLLSLIPMGCADRLILFPSTDPLPTTERIERREVPHAGGIVEIWICRSAGAERTEPRAYVLAPLGNAARAEYTAPFFARDWGQHPVEVWSLNYPGYGGSTGSARLNTIAPATLAAYDALKQHAGDKPIILEGRSLGSAAALYVATQRPVAGCVLHNPPPLRQLILKQHGWWNLWLIAGPMALSIPSELDNLANARRTSVPAIFVSAGADEVVPPEYHQLVIDAYAGPKRVIHAPGARHNERISGSASDEYEAAMDWLWGLAVKPR